MLAVNWNFDTARRLAGTPYMITGHRQLTPIPLSLAGFSGYSILPGARTNPGARVVNIIDYLVLLVGIHGTATAREMKRYTHGLAHVGSRLQSSCVETVISPTVTRYFTRYSRGVYGLTQLGRVRFMELTNSEI